jgi:hypothetical protein
MILSVFLVGQPQTCSIATPCRFSNRLNSSFSCAAIIEVFGLNRALFVLITGEFVALLAFIFFLRSLLIKRRQQLIAAEVRPPDCGKLLHPPGHWLQEQLFELAQEENDQILTTLAWVVFAGLTGAASSIVPLNVLVAPSLFSQPAVLWMMISSSFGLLLTVLCGVRAYQGTQRFLELRRDMERKRLGLRGEQAVAEALHSPEVAGAGYFTFHDVPSEAGGNIDHIVVGPGGVFIIETKTRSQQRPLQGKKRNRLYFDGATVTFPTGNWNRTASAQVQRNAECVRSWLQRVAASVTVKPLLVFPGWEVHMTEPSEVKAMSSHSLPFYFKDLAPRFSEAELKAMRAVLDARTRNVSF